MMTSSKSGDNRCILRVSTVAGKAEYDSVKEAVDIAILEGSDPSFPMQIVVELGAYAENYTDDDSVKVYFEVGVTTCGARTVTVTES